MELVINPAKVGDEMNKCVDYILDGNWSEEKQEAAIALEEAFVNICVHAYKDKAGIIKIRIDKSDEQIVMELWDTGKEYDPATAPLKEIEEGQIGGHGIRLMRTYCDLFYSREEDTNHLTMIKKLK